MQKLLYNSGDLFLPKEVKDVLETHIYGNYNQTIYITYWSFMHLLSGILTGYIYLSLGYKTKNYYWNLFIIHTLWEIWQIIIGMSKPLKIVGKNNIFDTILDTIFFMIGCLIIFHLQIKRVI